MTGFPTIKSLNGQAFSHDDDANKVIVSVTSNGVPVTLSGNVKAFIKKVDGTITVNGGIQNTNEAYVVLPDDAYVVGKIGVYLRIEKDDAKITFGGIEGYVIPSRLGNLIS